MSLLSCLSVPTGGAKMAAALMDAVLERHMAPHVLTSEPGGGGITAQPSAAHDDSTETERSPLAVGLAHRDHAE